MRIALAAVLTAGLAMTAAPASASSDPIHDLLYGYDCVQYPCYVTDYPPYVLDQLGAEVTVNPGYNCVTEPCDQPPLVTVCLFSKTFCTP